VSDKLPVPNKDGVFFLPLGGCGQFGANFTLYGYDSSWIAVDCGMAFADERLPGIDVILPDPKLIADQKEKLKALFVTHAHEDHIGAIAWLWPRLRCPIYATPFTAALLTRKLEEHVFTGGNPKITIVKPGEPIQVDGWKVTYIPVAHSIPEGNALTIETGAGRIVHTGDWCLDPDPILGSKTSPDIFRALGDAGVMAYVGDSTNAEVRGASLTENEVEQGLRTLFQDAPRKIAVTMFASNIGRVVSIHRAAQAAGRQVALIGRSLDTMVDCARQTGHVKDSMRFLSADEVGGVPDNKLVLIVTGSQGETRAALSRIARDQHPNVKMKPGDMMVFSSRAIPGNEVAINEIKNALLAQGVKIVTDKEAKIHVSGHPVRSDISQMLDWLRPKSVIPVHGERQQMESHADLAREKQIASVRVPTNGEMWLINDDGIFPERTYKVDFQAINFERIVPADHIAILERRKMSFNGAVFVSIAADQNDGGLLNVQVSAIGLLDPDNKNDARILTELEDVAADRYERLSKNERLSEEAGVEAVRAAIKRFFRDLKDIKPLVSVHIALV